MGYATSLVDGAVEAGAMALAAGRDPEAAVSSALPGWARGRLEVDVSGGRVTVALRPPSLVEAISRRLEVRASGWVRPAS